MEALRVWRASSNLLGFAASRAAAAAASAGRAHRFHIRCCSRCCRHHEAAAGPALPQRLLILHLRPRLYPRHSPKKVSSSSAATCQLPRLYLNAVEELRGMGYEPYAYKWDRTHTTKELQERYTHLEDGEVCTEAAVSIAGRIVARRAFGKLVFMTIRDDSGTIQLYCEKESLTEEQFEQLKAFIDVGDILGASGSIKKTEKGELSVYVNFFEILTKSLLPLPDKYHGLTDVDKPSPKVSFLYIDMIANPEVADVFRTRSKLPSIVVLAIFISHRSFLNSKTMESFGFIEVETPVLQGAAGGAEARPFITHHNSLQRDLYLRIATELHLKRMLVPWRRETMHRLVEEATGVDFNSFGDVESAKNAAKGLLGFKTESSENTSLQACSSVGHVLNEVFETVVESTLVQPTFVLDYPYSYEVSLDEDFLTSLNTEWPWYRPLVMLLTNSASIRDVIAFQS
ncbi:hypothetical protein ZWY2020_008647 [Hordeum vulgare]|nr:hypothetical protein ZWY2020_008647 [Hordeum vulgare]